jgi:hypothetical protein
LQKKDTDLLAETLHEGGNQELERSFGVEPEHIFLTGAAVNSRILLFFFKEVFSDLNPWHKPGSPILNIFSLKMMKSTVARLVPVSVPNIRLRTTPRDHATYRTCRIISTGTHGTI